MLVECLHLRVEVRCVTGRNGAIFVRELCLAAQLATAENIAWVARRR